MFKFIIFNLKNTSKIAKVVTKNKKQFRFVKKNQKLGFINLSNRTTYGLMYNRLQPSPLHYKI